MEGASDVEMRQVSKIQSATKLAVCVRNAVKQYGTKSNPFVILDGLNMTVPKGAIYGLLGASGCGKTTLLNCIVGRMRLNKGQIWVLGGTPGGRGSGVPEPRVGYMPQEVALNGLFTIRETMKYFGGISNMDFFKIEERLKFLTELLMLPDSDSLVKTLSGGQQRRVSLAASLLHEPELLILDEPTVAVDPLLRQAIWDHLVHITRIGQTTVIITTHYIDETKQADLIGYMREGHFLAEESPAGLLSQFDCDSLEDVFLELSLLQNKRKGSSRVGQINEAVVLDDEVPEITSDNGPRRVNIAPEPTKVIHLPVEMPPDEGKPVQCIDYFKIFEKNHMKTLIWKNFLWMVRNIPIMTFIICLPMIEISAMGLAFGRDPKNLSFSVVNHEINYPEEHCKTKFDDISNSSRLSCHFLLELEQRKHSLIYFRSEEEARNAVVHGEAWAKLVIPQNFTKSLKERIEYGRATEAGDLFGSTIAVYQDYSNSNIGTFVQRDLYFSFKNFFEKYLKSCEYNPRAGQIPILFGDPVYGDEHPDFTNFAAPGFLLSIVFFLALALTSGIILVERNEGILERSLVNGITGIELLLSHAVSQFSVMMIQTMLLLTLAFGVFDIILNGSLLLVFLLNVLTAMCGMCYGFVIACVVTTERTANYIAVGSFLPFANLCGIIWPTEAMPPIMQFASYFLPLRQSTDSLRCIMARGWGFEHPLVYYGFASTIFWILVYLAICLLSIKFRKG